MPDHGPFETERQASMTAEVQSVFAAFDADPGPGRMAPHNLAMLTSACEAARVELGAYDRGTLAWLGSWEPATCAVLAGIIRRAALLPDGAFTEADIRPCRHCGDPLIPCRPGHQIPVCKGWKHAAWLPLQIGAHYCEGRSIRPSGEPREEAPGG